MKDLKTEIEEDFVLYAEAVALKEIGFDEACFGYFVDLIDNKETPFKFVFIKSEKGQFENTDNVFHRPTYSQAFNWLRKKYDIDHIIYPYIESFKRSYLAAIYIGLEQKNMKNENMVSIRFYTYEEAELECLKKLIDIVKNELHTI